VIILYIFAILGIEIITLGESVENFEYEETIQTYYLPRIGVSLQKEKFVQVSF